MQEVAFYCTDDTFGMPRPHVPDGTVMILVQDGVAEVARYEEPRPPVEPSPAFLPAENAAELRAEAMRLVLAAVPEERTHGPCLHFVCPPQLAARAVWRRS